jgi:hypothetical protein
MLTEEKRVKSGWIFIGLSMFLLGALPLSANVIIVGGLTHEHEARIGESYEGVIEIKNIENKPQEVKIYQTDYSFYADGRILYSDPGKVPRSNARWITFSPKRLTVPPKDTVSVHYTVKVPDQADLTGTYWSIFMVELIPENSPESSTRKSDKVGLGIRQLFRYGIQVVTQIGDTGTRKLEFLSSKLLKEGAKQFLQLDIGNTGGRWLRSSLWVELYDEQGTYIGKYEGGSLRIYPATSVRFKVDLSSVPNNTYKALVVIDCGDDNVFGANFNLVMK